MPTYFRFEFRHIQPPPEPNFNRLVCSRIYSLSILNLFIVCSFVQFYPIVVSAWTRVTCAFFYCRISVPGGARTRDPLIKSQMLYLLSYWHIWRFTLPPRWSVSEDNLLSAPSGLIICFILDYCRDTSPRWVLSGQGRTRTFGVSFVPNLQSDAVAAVPPTHYQTSVYTIIRCLLVFYWVTPVGDFFISAKP